MNGLITVNDERGDVCCVATNPGHMCPKCRARLKANRNLERKAMSHDDLLLPPKLDFGEPTANAATDPTFDYGVAEDTDALLCPTLNFKATPPVGASVDDRNLYPKSGVRDVAPLTSGMPRVKPNVPARGGMGGDIGSYPASGTRGDLGTTDSAGDVQDDPAAAAGDGLYPPGKPRGDRSDRGRAVEGAVPQYGDAPPVEDRTDGQRGQFHTAGSYGSLYAADFFAGNRPLPTEHYTVTQEDRDAESRRQFGNQPIMNEDEFLPPSPNWAEWAKTWPTMARPR
jgi:hypothetical protein